MDGFDPALIEKYGVLALIAIAMFWQNKSYQDSMRKQLEDNTARATKQIDDVNVQSVAREARMADQIDAMEKEIRGSLEDLIVAQQRVLTEATNVVREATNVIRENTIVIQSIQKFLPRSEGK